MLYIQRFTNYQVIPISCGGWVGLWQYVNHFVRSSLNSSHSSIVIHHYVFYPVCQQLLFPLWWVWNKHFLQNSSGESHTKRTYNKQNDVSNNKILYPNYYIQQEDDVSELQMMFSTVCYSERCHNHCLDNVFQVRLLITRILRSSSIWKKLFVVFHSQEYSGPLPFTNNWGHLTFTKNGGHLPFEYWGCLPYFF